MAIAGDVQFACQGQKRLAMSGKGLWQVGAEQILLLGYLGDLEYKELTPPQPSPCQGRELVTRFEMARWCSPGDC